MVNTIFVITSNLPGAVNAETALLTREKSLGNVLEEADQEGSGEAGTMTERPGALPRDSVSQGVVLQTHPTLYSDLNEEDRNERLTLMGCFECDCVVVNSNYSGTKSNHSLA